METEPGKLITRTDWIACLFITAVTQIVYLMTLAPTVTSEDSGELIAAAYTLGVAHPPGYPLWTILGKVFTLIPGADPAWSVNWMSAVFGTLTAVVVYLICRRFSVSTPGAAASGLCVAFSKRFWSQAVMAEVYTLNTFLFCVVILLLLIWKERKEDRWLMAAAGVYGLSLTNHYMLMVLISPALGAYVFLTDRTVFLRYRTVIWCVVLAALPLVIYAYLPWAASRDPLMNWGDPCTWERFYQHVTRAQYRKLDFGAEITPSIKLFFFGHFLYLFWHQFTPYLLLVFVPLGWLRMKGMPREKVLLAGIFVFNTFILLLILKFTFEAENMSRVEEYYLPAYICAAVIMGLGLTAASEWLKNKSLLKFLVLAAPVLPLSAHWSFNNLSDYYLALDYNRVIMNSLDKDAVYVTGADYNSFPCVYLQAVEGMRPDVILANITGRTSKPARKLYRSITQDASEKPPSLKDFQEAVITKSGRPVYFTSRSDVRERRKYRFDLWGLVYRVSPRGDSPINESPDVFTKSPLRNLTTETSLDDMALSILSSWYTRKGEYLLVKGKKEEAGENLRKAADYSRTNKEGLNNIGGICAEHGMKDLAEEFLVRAARLYPGHLTPRRNLARIYEEQGRWQEALHMYRELLQFERDNESLKRYIATLENSPALRRTDRLRDLGKMLAEIRAALKEEPDNPSLYNNLGNIHAERGETTEALKAYRTAIAKDRTYARVYKNLSVLYRNVLKDKAAADKYMQMYNTLKSRKAENE